MKVFAALTAAHFGRHIAVTERTLATRDIATAEFLGDGTPGSAGLGELCELRQFLVCPGSSEPHGQERVELRICQEDSRTAA